MEQQNTLNSFCDGQENAQNCFPYKNENEETTCTEKDPLAVQVEQPKDLENNHPAVHEDLQRLLTNEDENPEITFLYKLIIFYITDCY